MSSEKNDIIKQFLSEGSSDDLFKNSEDTFERKVAYNLKVKQNYLDRFSALRKYYSLQIDKVFSNDNIFTIDKYSKDKPIESFMAAAFTPEDQVDFPGLEKRGLNLGLLENEAIQSFLEEE